MTNNWITNWKADLDQMALELPQRHKNLFFSCAKDDFERQIDELKGNLEQFDNFMIAVHIAKIVASIKDAHTALMMPAMRFIPLEFYWFEEGMYVVAASREHESEIHARITHIDKTAIDDVIPRVAEIVARENTSFLKAQLPKYLSSAEALYGLEIIDDFDKVELTMESPDGTVRNIMTDTCPSSDFHRSICGPDNSSESGVPLYRQNRNMCFWSRYLEDENTLYFNYNSCKNREDISVLDFCAELMDFIEKNEVQKLIIDLRNNLGGNSSLLDPFIERLAANRRLNSKGGIFVILGRDTFSSALLNAYALKNKTAAIFVGEATGGKPNCYGEVEYLQLKNSRLKIRYSTVYYEVIEDNELESFFPDIEYNVTFTDYINNRDACVEYALAFEE